MFSANTANADNIPLTPTYSVVPTANNVNEGSSATFNVSGTNIVNGTYYWTIGERPEDFVIASNSFTISNNRATITVTPRSDITTEGSETFTVSIRSGSTSGPILATSYPITINDTSQSPPATASYQYAVIGGGGGGGGGGSFQTQTAAGGGGGAGGFLTGSLNTTGSTLSITVGAGGDGQFQITTSNAPTNGGQSAILDGSTYLVRAYGGGQGGAGPTLNNWSDGFGGGSGGGASSASPSNRGTGGNIFTGQGSIGGRGALLTVARSDVGAGGGGGAGTAGGNGSTSSGGSGGSGVSSSLAGSVCAGGDGGYTYIIAVNSRATSPGSGGSGGRYGTTTYTRTRGQYGANGLVVIAYPLSARAATATGTFTYSETGGNRVYRFTGPGTITF